MKNKKGFTLVELLAVIAILAILVIIALPNVLELFETARKNSFRNEVNEVYKAAKQRYVIDSMSIPANGSRLYSDDTTATQYNSINIQGGGKEFHYCVIVDGQGNIVELKVSNGTYYYTGTNVASNDAITDDTIKANSGDPNPYRNVVSTTGTTNVFCTIGTAQH